MLSTLFFHLTCFAVHRCGSDFSTASVRIVCQQDSKIILVMECMECNLYQALRRCNQPGEDGLFSWYRR